MPNIQPQTQQLQARPQTGQLMPVGGTNLGGGMVIGAAQTPAQMAQQRYGNPITNGTPITNYSHPSFNPMSMPPAQAVQQMTPNAQIASAPQVPMNQVHNPTIQNTQLAPQNIKPALQNTPLVQQNIKPTPLLAKQNLAKKIKK